MAMSSKEDCIGNGVSSDHTADGETLNHAANGFSSDLQSRNIDYRQAVDSDSHIMMFSCIYDALLWASHKNDPHLKASFDLPAQIKEADHVQISNTICVVMSMCCFSLMIHI
jgi:hypothetical protein